jgi:hypothetical protein
MSANATGDRQAEAASQQRCVAKFANPAALSGSTMQPT